jgi:hypothetical protein
MIPVHLADRGQFVPLLIDGSKLWVAVSDQSEVRDLLWQEVEVIKVDRDQLKDLLMCYRTDPRHKH